MKLTEKLKMTDDQIYKLHLLRCAGFATKKMMKAITLRQSIAHITQLVDNGADYETIKYLLIKDIERE